MKYTKEASAHVMLPFFKRRGIFVPPRPPFHEMEKQEFEINVRNG